MDFDEYYRAMWGDRWLSLREALLAPVRYHALDFGLKPYYLDEASYRAALALEVSPGERVLDLCAAPGGKSLVLASCLRGNGELLCNDRSAERRTRLQRVLDDTLPASWRAIIRVSGYDATRFGLYQKNQWDKVLLDAPCSSERHVLSSPHHLSQWSPARGRNLAVQQFAMVAAALDALRPGGILVYSTCALDPRENDEVMRKMLRKRFGCAEILPVSCEAGEATEFGWRIWPDVCHGAGPIYFCRVRKIT